MRTLYLIHHSHTDIGYTERQEKLMTYHKDFVLQAMAMLDHDMEAHGASNFRWQCENHWQVDHFYRHTSAEDQARFERYVRSGHIGLSAVYLNMTELVDVRVLDHHLGLAEHWGEAIHYPNHVAMTADINGYAWGFPDRLALHGITGLFSALHTHHGMYPLYKKQNAFYWEGPEGGKILMWVGEHYHLANQMGLCPEGDPETSVPRAVANLDSYLAHLDEEGYPYAFFPLMISGAMTDNAPPNHAILQQIEAINRAMEGRLVIRMATLEAFFHAVEAADVTLPTYRGDFTDWWADGVGSTPASLKIYREAQRKLALLDLLKPESPDSEALQQSMRELILYAEHTWGYSSSVIEPWDSLVTALEKKKDSYAIQAHTRLSSLVDHALAELGEVSIFAHSNQHYRVINPHATPYQGWVKLYVEFWEKIQGHSVTASLPLQVRDLSTGELLPSQGRAISRAYELEVQLSLAPHEQRELAVEPRTAPVARGPHLAYHIADGVEDIRGVHEPLVTPYQIQTHAFTVDLEPGWGIRDIIDHRLGRSIVDPDASCAPFSAIYQRTPAGQRTQTEIRRSMGRNRSAFSTQTFSSKLEGVEIWEKGEALVYVRLRYQLEGCSFYDVYLKIGQTLPILEARVALHKHSIWDPENLYVALPFTLGSGEETFIDKTASILRPGIDQLPGTCQSFYLLQNGIVKSHGIQQLIIATKDAPLVAFGDRQAGPVELCDGQNRALNEATPYSWVMNNFWETNFKADLGGFIEFRYTIQSSFEGTTREAMDQARILNLGILGFGIDA